MMTGPAQLDGWSENCGFTGSATLLWSYGAGVRFKTPKATLFRLDVARGGEGMQIHLKLGYSF